VFALGKGAGSAAAADFQSCCMITLLLHAVSLPEAADAPSPRTMPFSAHNRKELQAWRACHEHMREIAASYTRTGNQQRKMVLFGDSITESWRGTSYCKKVPRAAGIPAVLNSTLVGYHAPIALGIAADQTQHLLWRMQHGELAPEMAMDPRLTAVLLIGTNNLGHGYTVSDTTRGIVAVAHHLLNASSGRLLLNGLLPRGDRRKRRHAPKAQSTGHPADPMQAYYKDDLRAVNAALKASVANELELQYPRRVRYVDCGAPFAAAPTAFQSSAANLGLAVAAGAGPSAIPPPAPAKPEIVRRDLMPDRLHPNAAGQSLWGACIVRAAAHWGQ